MKLLVTKAIIFISPFLIVFVLFTSLDVFKIYKRFDNYNDTFITLNRGYLCYKTYLKYRDQEKFNSYIFGSSLSLSFTLEKWGKYLPGGSKPFHFDGNGEGLYGIYHKIKGKYLQLYLDEFCYKLNRRYFGEKLFDRLVIAVAGNYRYDNV